MNKALLIVMNQFTDVYESIDRPQLCNQPGDIVLAGRSSFRIMQAGVDLRY